MEAVALAFSTGWASGINAYLVVLVLGVSDRLGDYASIPDVLSRWDVLGVAGFLYAMEFIADKIPYLDSSWDAISTAIRPTVGAVIAVLLAGDPAPPARCRDRGTSPAGRAGPPTGYRPADPSRLATVAGRSTNGCTFA